MVPSVSHLCSRARLVGTHACIVHAWIDGWVDRLDACVRGVRARAGVPPIPGLHRHTCAHKLAQSVRSTSLPENSRLLSAWGENPDGTGGR